MTAEPEGKVRCPACGAQAASGAEWCPLCYEPLGRPRQPRPAPATVIEAVWVPPTNGSHRDDAGTSPAVAIPHAPPPPVPVEPSPEPADGPKKRAVWNCPVCGTTNDLEMNACPACGTPFTRLFEEKVERPSIDPKDAAKWSLVFPGLGHAKIGRAAEGMARAVLFVWPMVTAVLVALAHVPALGFVKGLTVVFVFAALLAYALAAIDAYRQAVGDPPILSPRYLLYGTAGLVITSVASLFLVVMKATHPR